MKALAIIIIAFLPTLVIGQTNAKKKLLKDVTYAVALYSSNENSVKQNAIQFSVSKPVKKQLVTITITGNRTRQPNQLADNEISFNINLTGKSKK